MESFSYLCTAMDYEDYIRGILERRDKAARRRHRRLRLSAIIFAIMVLALSFVLAYNSTVEKVHDDLMLEYQRRYHWWE